MAGFDGQEVAGGESQAVCAQEMSEKLYWASMNAVPVVASGMLSSEMDYKALHRQQQVQQAVHTLHAARGIRSDAALMADIRKYVRTQRDDLAKLLDDVG